ncbi:class I SAM-dependent methyltransferase [Alteribacter keqinensis]|uniref:Class I SAM-dependent methyltransferase n=1 Tax=Alteribacter keqinensis TaxID=2483800 RepID=A0A3M7TLU7_9BACI|nr:class I SAM-dependent methyltransferase [Alteribacter keqinensis]RNA66603.1 class I SAM-dependent methyltransferase [Alteribacter keqinensis]
MDNVIDYYTQFDEWGRLEREPIEFQVNMHYIRKYLPKSGMVLDNGAGPGKYAMALAEAGFQMTLTDFTPRLVEVAEKKAEELGLTEAFNGFHVADARDLNVFEPGRFNAALMMGPMYHLQEEEDRSKAISELKRVTKKDGIVFVAFMPRSKHVLTSLENPEQLKPNHTLEGIKNFSETGCFDHQDKGRFTGAYYSEVKDIKPFMEAQGFETLELIGSNPGALLKDDTWGSWLGKEELVEILIGLAADPYLLGASSHLLYIGRRM